MNIDYLPHLNTFGLISHFEVVKNLNYFSLIHPKTFQLNLVNTLFYSDYLKKYFKVQDISNLYFSKLVPLLFLINHSESLKKSAYIDTVCFLPNKDYNLSPLFFKTALNF